MQTRMDHGIIASEGNAPELVSPRLAGDPHSAKKEESDSPFAVSVSDVYEGPLDLLLDLIRKQDIDIYDIPIARITAQYLAYVEKIRELDVNVAADFIYMAAVLIHIKSKMLLPRDPSAKAEELEDPRTELVNRLLEHEKFKSAAQMLLQKQQDRGCGAEQSVAERIHGGRRYRAGDGRGRDRSGQDLPANSGTRAHAAGN